MMPSVMSWRRDRRALRRGGHRHHDDRRGDVGGVRGAAAVHAGRCRRRARSRACRRRRRRTAAGRSAASRRPSGSATGTAACGAGCGAACARVAPARARRCAGAGGTAACRSAWSQGVRGVARGGGASAVGAPVRAKNTSSRSGVCTVSSSTSTRRRPGGRAGCAGLRAPVAGQCRASASSSRPAGPDPGGGVELGAGRRTSARCARRGSARLSSAACPRRRSGRGRAPRSGRASWSASSRYWVVSRMVVPAGDQLRG